MNTEPILDAGPGILTLTELRVLSGLSRGAAMPLEESITIGSDFGCDLILVDPDVNGIHATLARGADGRLSLAIAIADSAGADALMKGQARRALHEGEPFEVAGIRMIVCESDAPWDFALPVSPPPQLSAIEAAVADGVAAGRLGPAAVVPRKPKPKLGMDKLALIGKVAVMVALIAATAYWLIAREEPPPPTPPAPVKHVYTDIDLQAIATAFAGQLEALGIPGMKVTAGLQLITVQGFVDRLAEPRFEAAVQQLRDGHPGLKVRLELAAEGKSALPFEITAAVGGANGSVLLGDGQQLFVGAEEEGFKFLGLTGSCINFMRVATQQTVSQCSDSNPRRR